MVVADRFAERVEAARALLREAAPAATTAAGATGDETAGAEAVLCDPALLTLPPDRGLLLELHLLCALCPAPRAALWLAGVTGGLTCRGHVGEASEHGRAAAARVVASGAAGTPSAGELVVAPVLRWGKVDGALVVEAGPAPRTVVDRLAGLAAGMIGALLDREVLLARNARGEEALVHASERRLTRLALDLHDGPLQDVAALGDELRDLRRRLGEGVVPGAALADRFDDLEAWLRAIDAELRRISATVGAPVVVTRPFEELLREATDRFRERSRVQVAADVTGALDDLSDSQRLALVRIVQEALANIREHAEAGHVSVTVRATHEHVEATITDDGMGFEVDAALQASSARTRQGLAGMQERARLLGGACRFLSRPGGPTTVSVRLPAWRQAG